MPVTTNYTTHDRKTNKFKKKRSLHTMTLSPHPFISLQRFSITSRDSLLPPFLFYRFFLGVLSFFLYKGKRVIPQGPYHRTLTSQGRWCQAQARSSDPQASNTYTIPTQSRSVCPPSLNLGGEGGKWKCWPSGQHLLDFSVLIIDTEQLFGSRYRYWTSSL